MCTVCDGSILGHACRTDQKLVDNTVSGWTEIVVDDILKEPTKRMRIE